MTLSTNVYDLAIRIASESKKLRTLINGNLEDLAGLDTTTKTNLVAAINEVVATVATASGIDDTQTSLSTSWSSSKTSTEITSAVSTASTADRDRANHTGTESADVLVDGSTNKAYTAAEKTKLGGIATGATANQTDAYLLDLGNSTGTLNVADLADFQTALAGFRDDLLGGAGSAYDTLGELSTLIEDNADLISSLQTVAANKVSFEAQTLTAPQQVQARTNIDAASTGDVTALSAAIGSTITDYVSAFEAALL